MATMAQRDGWRRLMSFGRLWERGHDCDSLHLASFSPAAPYSKAASLPEPFKCGGGTRPVLRAQQGKRLKIKG